MTELNHLLQRLCDADVESDLFGHTVFVIGIEDLIKAKAALGRDKDLLAVKELRAILEKNMHR